MEDEPRAEVQATPTALARIAVGLDGYREGRDAAVLASSIAGAAGSNVMLVAVHPDPMVVLPAEIGWSGLRKEAQRVLRETRDAVAPGARMVVETDWSIPRALERVAQREHRNLIAVGSSRRGPEGRVRIGNLTRQLLSHSRCALAVAPRGFSEHAARRIARIGGGYDGAPESEAALALAGSLAIHAGATLHVQGVVDDSVPMVGWQSAAREQVLEMWEELLKPQVAALLERAQSASEATGADVGEVEVRSGEAVRLMRCWSCASVSTCWSSGRGGGAAPLACSSAAPARP